jgi:hypothetical protein
MTTIKRAVGKGKQHTTKRTVTGSEEVREHTRSQQVQYNFSEDEEGLHDETQGYVCVSSDPRNPGSAEGGRKLHYHHEGTKVITESSMSLGNLRSNMEDSDRGTDSNEDTTWEPNPLPLMTKHPPRVTASNTKIQLDREGILSQTCPRGVNDLGWVQLPWW